MGFLQYISEYCRLRTRSLLNNQPGLKLQYNNIWQDNLRDKKKKIKIIIVQTCILYKLQNSPIEFFYQLLISDIWFKNPMCALV